MQKVTILVQERFRSATEQERKALIQAKMEQYIRTALRNKS